MKFIFSVSLVFTPISKYHRACLYLYFKGIKQWIFGFGSSKFGILRYHLNQTHIQVHLSFSTSESTCYHFFRSGSHLRLIYWSDSISIEFWTDETFKKTVFLSFPLSLLNLGLKNPFQGYEWWWIQIFKKMPTKFSDSK